MSADLRDMRKRVIRRGDRTEEGESKLLESKQQVKTSPKILGKKWLQKRWGI